MKKLEIIEDVKQYTDEELMQLFNLLKPCVSESWHVDEKGLYQSTKVHVQLRRIAYTIADELTARSYNTEHFRISVH